MPSKPDLPAAVMLAALLLLLQRAYGAPFGDASSSTNGRELEPSGDTGWPSDTLMAGFNSVLAETGRHRKEFNDEFLDYWTYEHLASYEIPISLPKYCPISNSNKETCLRLLLQGLKVYTVLLKLVAQECPSSSIPTEARKYIGFLMIEIENKMRNPKQVKALTSSEEEQLLRDFDDPDGFHRKMTAHRILYELHHFLTHDRRVINKMENPRSPVSRS